MKHSKDDQLHNLLTVQVSETQDARGTDKQSGRSRSSTRLPAASPGGELPSRFRSASRQQQASSKRAPSTDAQRPLPDKNRTADRISKLTAPVRDQSPGLRGRQSNIVQPHKQHLLQPHKQAMSRIPYRTPTPPLPGASSMPDPAFKPPSHTQLPRTHSHNPAAQFSPARPPQPPLLPRMFSPSEPFLQGNKGLHERGLLALKEYRRLRNERMEQALRARQQQQLPTGSNGHLRYTIQQPPFLAGRARTSSNPPNHHQITPTSREGRSGKSQSPLSATTRTPFSADRPLTSRRGSSVCSERRGALSAVQRSGSGTTSTPPATPPDHNRNGAVSVSNSPALQVSRGPVLKLQTKVTPQLQNRTSGRRKDSQMHADASLLQPQSPPSLGLQDQRTETTLTASSGRTDDGTGGMGGGMEDLLLQQVTALLSEKSNWTSEKQRLEKEVEQLHELIEYLFEQFNVPMDDASVPLDELTGLPQYLPGSDSNIPHHSGSVQFAASAELPPSMGSFVAGDPHGDSVAFQTQSAQLPPLHSPQVHHSMMSASNGNAMHYTSADLPPVPRGDLSKADIPPHYNHNGMSQQHHSNGVLEHSIVDEQYALGGPGDVYGPVAEADASFVSMLCDNMTMMSASDAPHAGALVNEKSASPRAFPLVVDGPGRR